jgi:hypothetical protein
MLAKCAFVSNFNPRQSSSVKHASDKTGGQTAEVRRIVRDLQERAQRYLVVRASRYENLLRAAPATHEGVPGHVLAFPDELVIYRRMGTAVHPSTSQTSFHSSSSAGNRSLRGGGGGERRGRGIIRIAYKEIVDVVSDGSRLCLQLSASESRSSTPRGSSVFSPSELVPGVQPTQSSGLGGVNVGADTRNRWAQGAPNPLRSMIARFWTPWRSMTRRSSGLFHWRDGRLGARRDTFRGGLPVDSFSASHIGMPAAVMEASGSNLLTLEMEGFQACDNMQVRFGTSRCKDTSSYYPCARGLLIAKLLLSFSELFAQANVVDEDEER